MDLVAKCKALEEFVEKYDLDSKFIELAELKDENAIPTSSELENVINKIENDSRELKLGIIGRVKAGKSSLLNSLYFKGKDILPKAATPMTAALTILKYGDSFGATIDFFSKEDIDELKKGYEKYNEAFEKEVESIFKKEKEEAQKKAGSSQSDSELRAKALKRARINLKSSSYYVSFEQYEKIQKSGIVDIENLPDDIQAQNVDELKTKLQDYVGADGKYMPITKSVTIMLNIAELKGVEIIDTPGINDPVVSREERTRELLKYCDAVFLISPSGQFLSSEDLTLLDRVSIKEGVSEFRIIASQADTNLFGDIYQKSNQNLSKAIELITTSLSSQAKEAIGQFKEDSYSESIRNMCDRFLKENVIISSSKCYDLWQKFDEKSKWAEDENHIYGLLNEKYKDFFDDSATAKNSLARLANIKPIEDELADIKNRKDEILQKKKDEYIKASAQKLDKFINDIKKILQDKIMEIENTDSATLSEKIDTIHRYKKDTSIFLEDKFEDISMDFTIKIKDKLKKQKDDYFNKARKSIQANQETKTETRTRSWLWIFTETYIIEYQIVHAGDIRNSLYEMIIGLESILNDSIKEKKKQFKIDLFNAMLVIMRENMGDGNIDVASLTKTIKSVISSIKIPEFDYSDRLPNKLKKNGTLKRWEAQEYVNAASAFVYDFIQEADRDIKTIIKTIQSSLENRDIASDIFSVYEKQLEELKEQIANIKESIKYHNTMLDEIKMIETQDVL